MRGWVFSNFFGCVFGNDLVVIGVVFGIQVYDLVGGFDYVQVVFDYYDGVVVIV